MALLPALTRDQVPGDLQPLWDECEKVYPSFRHLWATMAHSPIVFRHIWGELLDLKCQSPVAARHVEIAIVVVSSLNRCRFCVSHHTPMAETAGLTPPQIEYLSQLTLVALPADYPFPVRPRFSRDDSLVIDLAYLLVWNGIYPHVADVHPHVIVGLRHRLFGLLTRHFSDRQIEELTWRIAQCVAFNWHNDFLELEDAPDPGREAVGVRPTVP